MLSTITSTISKLALLAGFDSTVKSEESYTNTMPVPTTDQPSSSETSTYLSIEETISNTIGDVPESNSLENFQSQLDAFEKRLLNDYSAQDMLPETDLKLPMLVIDNFSKIFRLWHNNPVLKNSIESKVFYDIFSSMFRSLNEEPAIVGEQTGEHAGVSDLTGVCDICDEEFELIQNDAQKSFAEHERSAAHIDAVNLLNKIGTGDSQSNILNQPACKSSNTKQKTDDVWKQNSYCLEQLNGNPSRYECYLCDIVCYNNRINAKNHCNSKIHKKHLNYFLNKSRWTSKRTEFNDDMIFSREDSFFCVLCQCVRHKLYRNQHVNSQSHIGWKNFARKVIKLEKPYLHKIDQNSDICVCELCTMKFSMTNIISHCQTKEHISLKIFAEEIQCTYFQ